MISKQDLLYNPEKYNPLGSVKGIRNVDSKDFLSVDLREIFLDKLNGQKLTKNLFQIHRQNGGKSTVEKFHALIPKLMNKFARENNLNLYRSVEDDAIGYQNWMEALNAINYDFTKSVYKLFKWNIFVPTREYAEVGDSENRRHVKFTDMQAADIPTLDVWKEQQIVIMNKHFRNNNQIPVWRSSIHTRNYDRDTEEAGYKYDIDQSSRENFQRGFNMENIESLIDKWQSSEWFGT